MKELLFILSDGVTDTTLKYSPDGWDESMIDLERSDLFYGIVRAYTVKLDFLKDGNLYLRNVYFNYGVKKTISLTIQKLNKKTQLYEIKYTGNIDFNSINLTKRKCSVSTVETGFYALVKQNYNIKFDIITDTTYLPTTIIKLPLSTSWSPTTFVDFKGIHISDMIKYVANKMLGGVYSFSGGTLGGQYLWTGGIFGGDYDIDTSIIDGSDLFFCNYATTASSDGIAKMNLSFEDIFKILDSNFGLSIDVVWTGTKYKLIIKTKDDIFRIDTYCDFGEISNYKIYQYDKVFSDITVGWDSSGDASTSLPICPPEYSPDPHAHPQSIGYFEINKSSNWKYDTSLNNSFDATVKIKTDFGSFFDQVYSSNGNYDVVDAYLFNVPESTIGSTTARRMFFYHLEKQHLGMYPENYIYNNELSPKRCFLRNQKYYNSLMYNICDYLSFAKTEMTQNDVKSEVPGSDFAYLNEHDAIAIDKNNIYFKPIVIEITSSASMDSYDKLKQSNVGVRFTNKGNVFTGIFLKMQIKVSSPTVSTITMLCGPDNDLTKLK